MRDPNFRRAAGEGAWQLQTHGSGLLEQVLEYQLLAALTLELLRRGMRFEVLRGDFDLDGHDLVIEAGGVMLYIQLKGIAAGGKSRHVQVNTRLQTKTSGCVVWMTYDPESLAILGLRWFGGTPGERLPDLGERVARHTRANRDGVKGQRPNIRILPASRFEILPDVAALAHRLFGPAELVAIRLHLARRSEPASGWLAAVQAGNFSAIPADLDWGRSLELAMLIDGYGFAGDLGIKDPMEFADSQLQSALHSGAWSGNAAELWLTLFLEHRRWRFSSPHEPDPVMQRVLDLLVRQLRGALG